MRRAELIQDVFHAVLSMPVAERRAFLEKRCAGDPELEHEVSSLISALAADPDYLDARSSSDAGVTTGTRLGPYEIVREIASGGMGTVYLARRVDGEFDRQVAIKIIRRDRVLPAQAQELVDRFRAERQYLAQLEHPNIAHLLDGGTAHDGSPYLVMEYIEGAPVHEYCRERALPQRARLQLFQVVCEAVQYAHTKLVVHRDLKPSNILVAEVQGKPSPKLLDFGIARLLRPDGDAELASTAAQVSRLTPAYASPEQFRRGAVTTAMDVYSLGVVLYELLTGQLPYALAGKAPHDVSRIICEEPPIDPRKIVPDLDDDLATILKKALEKEPGRRYQSPSALALDIDRFLTGLPIAARPPSTLYQWRKTVSRHRLAFAMAAALFVTTTSASIWMSVLYARATNSESLAEARRVAAEQALGQAVEAEHAARMQRERADAARTMAEEKQRQAETTARLLRDVFASGDPFHPHGRELTVAQALDRATLRYAAELDEHPEVLAAMGAAYLGLSESAKAETALRRAVTRMEETEGADHPSTLRAWNDLANLLADTGRSDEAEQAYRRVAAGASDPDLSLNAQTNLAINLHVRGRSAEAEPLLREAVDRCNQLGNEGESACLAMRSLGLVLASLWNLEESERWLRRAAQREDEIFGPDHPRTLETKTWLAGTLRVGNRINEALELMRIVAPAQESALGARHKVTLLAQRELAQVLMVRGSLSEAESILSRIAETQHEIFGDEHIDTLDTLDSLAVALTRQHRVEEAEELLRHVVELRTELLGSDHMTTLYSMGNLGWTLKEAGRLADAEAVFTEAAETARGSEHPARTTYGWLQLQRAACLMRLSRLEEAEACLRRNYSDLQDDPKSSSNDVQRTIAMLVQLFESRGNEASAAEFRALLK